MKEKKRDWGRHRRVRRGVVGGKLLALPEKMVDGGAQVKEDEEEDDGDMGEV